jgi:hypothetical protein
MGTVITFPDVWRNVPTSARNDGQGEPATIIILPVIRVERHAGDPSDAEPGTNSPGRPGRGRHTRS